MPTKLLAPNTTIWWVPASGIADYMAPTVAEINAGINISCAIITGYTLGATDSDTDNTRSICDEANVDTPTNDNYEASLNLFRGITTETTGVYSNAFTAFRYAGANGYLVRRVGKKNDLVAAVGDRVELFRVESDHMKTIESDNNGPIQSEVTFLPQGQMNLFYELAA